MTEGGTWSRLLDSSSTAHLS